MRTLDFLVIGAPQSGTTSLWQGLASHPQIRVPADKERGFFNSDDRYARGIDWFVNWTFKDLADDQVAGTVTPQLMPDNPRKLGTVVDRIAETVPSVKIVVILRNPIDRAVSHYRRGLRDGGVGADDTFSDLVARRAASTGDLSRVPIVAIGEYGRILARYRERFSAEQFLILFTDDLDSRPGMVYRRLFEFLGVSANHKPLIARANVGGTRHRVSSEGLEELLDQMTRTVWPHVSDPEVARGFNWWLRHIWNIEPDQMQLDVEPDLRSKLARLYLADARLLRELFDCSVPWISALKDARDSLNTDPR